MNQRKTSSNTWFGIVSIIIGIGMIAYLSIYAWQAFQKGIITVEAVGYTYYDSVKTEGVIVRDEKPVIRSGGGDFVFTAAQDGKRVSVGEVIAYGYTSYDVWKSSERAHQIDEAISKLNWMLDARGEISQERFDSGIRGSISELRSKAETGDYRAAKDVAEHLLQVAKGASDVKNTLSGLHAERAAIPNASATVLTADESALFSRTVDGYAGSSVLNPSNLGELSPDRLTIILSTKLPSPAVNSIGKLVYGQIWYYATNVADRTGTSLSQKIGQEVNLLFEGLKSPITMNIVSVSFPQSGKRTVVFSCPSALSEAADMRITSAEIILSEYNGLRIPRDTLRLEPRTSGGDPQPCVYVVSGPYLERKFVTIVAEDSEFYIISDDVYTTDAVRNGEMIVVGGHNLYDGKIIGG